MPYIPEERRIALLNGGAQPQNAGELNFLFTDLINRYISANGMRYQQCNDIIGALEGAKLEFYRRLVGPYEDIKIQENGDVYFDQKRKKVCNEGHDIFVSRCTYGHGWNGKYEPIMQV